METRLIVFDFDGTLGDTRQNIILTMRQTMAALGLPEADEAAISATIGIPLEAGFRELYPHLDEAGITRCTATYREIFEKNRKELVPALFPSVGETLSDLKGRGLVMSVASSRSEASLNGFLADMGIAGCFSLVLGADSVTRAKPDPEPVLLTLKALGFPASETLVVGDMPVDILMGRRAGARTCGVTYGNADRAALVQAGADFILDDFAALAGLV